MRRMMVALWLVMLLAWRDAGLWRAPICSPTAISAGASLPMALCRASSPPAGRPSCAAERLRPFGDGPGADAHAQTLSGGPYSAGIFQRASGLDVGEHYRVGFEVYPAPNGASTLAYVGLDPLGGTDPNGAFVAWSPASSPRRADAWRSASPPP